MVWPNIRFPNTIDEIGHYYIEWCWSKDPTFVQKCTKITMRSNIFEILLRMRHFVNNQVTNPIDRLNKIRRIHTGLVRTIRNSLPKEIVHAELWLNSRELSFIIFAPIGIKLKQLLLPDRHTSTQKITSHDDIKLCNNCCKNNVISHHRK